MMCRAVLTALPAVFIAAAFFIIFAARAARRTKHRMPKNASPPSSKPLPKGRLTIRDCTRDPFKEKAVPPDVDYVIVGSGMGSLYCAALLSKAGKRVVVLEQHYVAGGCTHSFLDQGYEFDTGLHYVGRVEKYKKLLDLVTGRDAKKVEWAKMGTEADGFCYDEIKLGGEAPFPFRAGEQAFVDGLAAEFPSERGAIVEYVRLCKKVNNSTHILCYPCHDMLCHAMPCHAMLCYAMLCCAML